MSLTLACNVHYVLDRERTQSVNIDLSDIDDCYLYIEIYSNFTTQPKQSTLWPTSDAEFCRF